jgi:hypothetical protein
MQRERAGERKKKREMFIRLLLTRGSCCGGDSPENAGGVWWYIGVLQVRRGLCRLVRLPTIHHPQLKLCLDSGIELGGTRLSFVELGRTRLNSGIELG